jgi:hypothetical protein
MVEVPDRLTPVGDFLCNVNREMHLRTLWSHIGAYHRRSGKTIPSFYKMSN